MTIVIVLAFCFVLLFWYQNHQKNTGCQYCGRTNRRHDSHCPYRIVEDDD